MCQHRNIGEEKHLVFKFLHHRVCMTSALISMRVRRQMLW